MNYEVIGPFNFRTSEFDDWFILKNRCKFHTVPSCEAVWFGIKKDGVPVAIGALDPEYNWLGPSYVSESYRGCGIQFALIEARLRYASQIGLEKIRSAVDVDNSSSLKNLLNAGFKSVGWCEKEKHINLVYDVKGKEK